MVIDEAHNLIDAINNMYSISVSQQQLKRSKAQLIIYLQKFRNRLKGKNRVYVAQTVRLLDALTTYLERQAAATTTTTATRTAAGAQQQQKQQQQEERLVNASDLMAEKGVDQINLFKLMRYLQESKLARKVEGYTLFTEQQKLAADGNNQSGSGGSSSSSRIVRTKGDAASMPVLTHVQAFLFALTHPSAEGRIFYTREEDNDGGGGGCLKYLLLDPTHHFREVVDEARAVILAGGTMSPVSCLCFSCGTTRYSFVLISPSSPLPKLSPK